MVKNGSVIDEAAVDGDPFVYELATTAPASDEDRYRHEVVDATNRVLTVTSYVWLQRAEEPTPTPTETAAPSPTATLAPPRCAGDCDGRNGVEIHELLVGVNIALGSADLAACPVFDRDDSGGVEVAELIAAVQASLSVCE